MTDGSLVKRTDTAEAEGITFLNNTTKIKKQYRKDGYDISSQR